MQLRVQNCPRCGRVFVPAMHDVCQNCVKEIEEEYEKCYKYLRENRECTIYELSDATGVSIRQISRFIREGRLSLKDAPNMAYPCESCGTLIQEHTLCPACRNKLAKELARAQEQIMQKSHAARTQPTEIYQIRKQKLLRPRS